DHGPCSDRRRGSGVHVGGPRCATPREWGTRARARGLVPAIPRLLSLLPPSTAATSGTRGAHRNPASVAVSSFRLVARCGFLLLKLWHPCDRNDGVLRCCDTRLHHAVQCDELGNNEL